MIARLDERDLLLGTGGIAVEDLAFSMCLTTRCRPLVLARDRQYWSIGTFQTPVPEERWRRPRGIEQGD